MAATPASNDLADAPSTSTSQSDAEVVPVNHIVLIAKVTSPPERHTLPSGDEVVSFGVSVPRDEGGVDAVPIQAGPAPGPGKRRGPGQIGRRILADAERLQPGTWVRVEGRLRRRWWAAGGMRRSRVEVAAASVALVEP